MFSLGMSRLVSSRIGSIMRLTALLNSICANLVNVIPVCRWKHRVNRGSLRLDLIAGLTGAIVVLPQGVAFATIAGMPPEYGLYAGMIPAVIAALFGSSWHLVSGPTTAASIVLFSSLSVLAEPGTAEYVSLALTLTFMVGVIELVLGMARLGTLVNFISHSVVIGFTAGAALLIISKQLKNFFGVNIRAAAIYRNCCTFSGNSSPRSTSMLRLSQWLRCCPVF